MSRYSDYARNRNPGIASSDIDDPFEGFPSDDPYDRHLGDPRYRRYSPEGYGDGRLRIIASDPFMSEPTNPHLSERCTRGYNPPYYGRAPCQYQACFPSNERLTKFITAYTGSQPGGGDYGFGLENPDVAFGTPMGNGYAEYKKLDARSDLYKAGYEGRRNGIPPRPPPKLQTEEYVGSPPMIRRHHRELYDHASGAADAARE